VGIVTEAEHSRARILHIQPERISRHLKDNKVVVVAGFQGITNTAELEITTLGRGVLIPGCCPGSRFRELTEIYTDVPGILTADPRLVPDAQRLKLPAMKCWNLPV